jgi:PhnB protein
MQVQPYVCFEGQCEEAIAFYREAIGAEVVRLMRFKEAPGALESGMIPPTAGEKVMHADLKIGEDHLLVSDGRMGEPARFQGISLALQVPTEAAADKAFAGLSAGGQVTMPLAPTFWSKKFGMVTDKFGVAWMVNVVA